jgi:MFS family permease
MADPKDFPGTRGRPLTSTEWLICALAAIGFAFDIYELLMAPLIAGPALRELLGPQTEPKVISMWVGQIFWWSAMSGGVFGLLGGYLTDRFGRRRVLVGSILLYAGSAFAAGYSTSAMMLLILRCTTFIGVCVEFVAAVAWLAELFEEPQRRERVLGYTQAFSSVGGLLVTGASWLCTHYAASLPAIHGGHSAWRYTLISGVIPALPLILVRPFLPESPVWKRKKEDGTLRRASIAELFRPRFARTTLVTAFLFATGYGIAFGAIQLIPSRVVASLSGATPQSPNSVQLYQELGGLLGRLALAFLATRIISRRRLLRVFQLPALIIVPLVFWFPARDNLELLKWGMAIAGFLIVAQFSFWGNYLPRVYPVHLRGTGESFAANIGGRMLGTSAAFVTTTLVAPHMAGSSEGENIAMAAAVVSLGILLLGNVLTFFLPEPSSDELPE